MSEDMVSKGIFDIRDEDWGDIFDGEVIHSQRGEIDISFVILRYSLSTAFNVTVHDSGHVEYCDNHAGYPSGIEVFGNMIAKGFIPSYLSDVWHEAGIKLVKTS